MKSHNIAIAAALIGTLLYSNFQEDLIENYGEQYKHQEKSGCSIEDAHAGNCEIFGNCHVNSDKIGVIESRKNEISNYKNDLEHEAENILKSRMLTTNSIINNGFEQHLQPNCYDHRGTNVDYVSELLKGDSACASKKCTGLVIRKPLLL